MRELICIVCPNGCRIEVGDSGDIMGYRCERGREYAQAELTNPTRVLTSTVRMTGGAHRRCPVKTDGPIPKGLLMEAMELLCCVDLQAPIECGQIIVENFLGMDVNLIATRSEAKS